VNVSSKSGLNIATGEVLSLKAPNISIQADNQTFIKNNLAVDGNTVCRGGMMVQGELFAQHITAPLCFQETETQSELYGRAYPEKPLIMGFIKNTQEIKCTMEGTLTIAGAGIVAGTTPVTGGAKVTGAAFTITLTQFVPIYTTDSGQKAEDGSIYVYPHSHVFRNLPLTLGGTYEEVRGNAAGIDGNDLIPSKKVENGMTASEIKGTTREKGVGLQNQLEAKEFTPIEI
jgi:hypothetical protein